MVAEQLDDVEGALGRYEAIVKDLDPRSRIALHAIAELHEKRGDQQGVAAALERELVTMGDADGVERVDLAQRLAQLYEGPLADPRAAIRALDVVHAADPEDFDAIARLQHLSEQVEDWPRVATLMASLIEVEGDEEEASRLTVRLAGILADKLQRGDEALSALEKLADAGDAPCRDAYVALGDKLGWKGIVATKLVVWHESGMGAARNDALRSAFVRFLEIGRDQDAARLAMEVARARAADRPLAEKLEELATRLRDLDALAVAHDLLGKELSGAARAAELVRQAEVQVAAGIDPLEAMQHGESGLSSVPPGEVEPLLGRLAALTQAPGHVVDLYERQVGRCRVPADRLAALARAAQVAAERGANDRARSFFELALGGGIQEDTLVALEAAARLGDEKAGGVGLRTTLAEALAAGGQGSRDGGRTRGALLRRAATIAHRDLGDVDKAFGWLGDALITHVDDPSLDALEALGREVGAIPRVEATLSRALEEVFDGPLVRKLLQRRARLRRDVLDDKKGAAVDLKKLHDLSPSDLDVMNELSSLLLELGDHRGMIQLYEDQILRGRDPAQRAELARKVARLWEEELADARESADAWRRVLRMKAGDPEATSGLDRAKTGKLKRAPPKPVLAARGRQAHGPAGHRALAGTLGCSARSQGRAARGRRSASRHPGRPRAHRRRSAPGAPPPRRLSTRRPRRTSPPSTPRPWGSRLTRHTPGLPRGRQAAPAMPPSAKPLQTFPDIQPPAEVPAHLQASPLPENHAGYDGGHPQAPGAYAQPGHDQGYAPQHPAYDPQQQHAGATAPSRRLRCAAHPLRPAGLRCAAAAPGLRPAGLRCAAAAPGLRPVELRPAAAPGLRSAAAAPRLRAAGSSAACLRAAGVRAAPGYAHGHAAPRRPSTPVGDEEVAEVDDAELLEDEHTGKHQIPPGK